MKKPTITIDVGTWDDEGNWGDISKAEIIEKITEKLVEYCGNFGVEYWITGNFTKWMTAMDEEPKFAKLCIKKCILNGVIFTDDDLNDHSAKTLQSFLTPNNFDHYSDFCKIMSINRPATMQGLVDELLNLDWIQNDIELKNKVLKLNEKQKFNSWKELMKESFLKSYKNKEEFLSTKFLDILDNEIDKLITQEKLNNDEINRFKRKLYESVWDTFEHDFHCNRLDMAEQIINNAMKICDAENLEELALFSQTLDWFIIWTSYMYNQDQKFDFDSIDASMYDEPIDYNSILDLLDEKEINDYNLPSIKEVFKNFKHIDESSFNDTRFLLWNDKDVEKCFSNEIRELVNNEFKQFKVVSQKGQ